MTMYLNLKDTSVQCSVCQATSHSQEMKKKLSYKNLLYFALVMLIMRKTFYGSKEIIEYKYNERNNKLPLMEQTVNKIFNKQELLTYSLKKTRFGNQLSIQYERIK